MSKKSNIETADLGQVNGGYGWHHGWGGAGGLYRAEARAAYYGAVANGAYGPPPPPAYGYGYAPYAPYAGYGPGYGGYWHYRY